MAEQAIEDIDLLRLLERAILFFKRFKWFFAGALLAGVISGWFFYRFRIPVTYKSRAVFHSFILTNPEQIQIVNNWNRQLKQKEYKTLSAALGCDEKLLVQTKELWAKEIQQAFTPNNPNGFTIDVIVTNNNVLDSLQKAIIYGFENGNYVKERLATKRESLKELIEKTTAEIQKLDSTKKEVENIIAGNGHASSSLIVDASSINRQLIEMNEKLLNYKESLEFTNAVQVLQGFSQFSQPDGPHLLPWLIIGVFFFMALAWVYAVISNINRKLKQRAAEEA
jgi:hypothetical protein